MICLRKRSQVRLTKVAVSAVNLFLPKMKFYSVLGAVSSDFTDTVPASQSVSTKYFWRQQTLFLCPSCYREQHEEEVKELKGTVETLRAELFQLKELLHAVREQANSSTNRAPCCSKSTCSYAAAAATDAATAATATVSEKLRDTRDNRPTVRQQPKSSWQTVQARQSNRAR